MATYDLNGVPIYYESYGEGPDLVFFHGYTCNLEDWRWTADQLSKSFRILLFDMRCHGRSGKDGGNLILSALTDEAHQLLLGLGIDNPIIVGHSMGGMIALDYGLRYPQSLRALVLAEAHTHIDTTARIIGSGVVNEHTQPEIAQKINNNMAQGAEFVTEDLFNSLLAFDVRKQVPKLKMPILFLWGDRYGELTPDKLPGILEAFGYQDLPNLTAEYIANSHHFIMLEKPEETLQAIQRFLDTLEPR
jgi:pimeloyl-ACP methyl ester carboxylesterase